MVVSCSAAIEARLGDEDRERIASSGRRVASGYPHDLPESSDEGAIPRPGDLPHRCPRPVGPRSACLTEPIGLQAGEGRVDVMAFHLTDAERSRMRSMVKRPRSRKQLYRAEALLALDEGQPIETVARKFRVGVERVEHWVSGFEKLRLAFLAEPDAGRPKERDADWDPDEAIG